MAIAGAMSLETTIVLEAPSIYCRSYEPMFMERTGAW